MHLRQIAAHGCAMRWARLHLRLTCQSVDHGGGFVQQGEQNIALVVGLGVGHGHTALGQMLHQVQIKRQLFVAQSLEHSQDIFALIGGEEVVGVFDAAADALK